MSAELIGMILAVLFLCAMSHWIGWRAGKKEMADFALKEGIVAINAAYAQGIKDARHDQK